MKIAFIGAGRVGAALAGRLVQSGHDVVLAQTREGSDSVQAALTRWPALRTAPLTEAVDVAEVVLLATPYAANEGLPLASRSGSVVFRHRRETLRGQRWISTPGWQDGYTQTGNYLDILKAAGIIDSISTESTISAR